MARVWVRDRRKERNYLNALTRAKTKGTAPPGRWQVRYYDRAGRLRSEIFSTKSRAEDRRSELEVSLQTGTYVDPAVAKVKFVEMAEKWLESRHDIQRSTWWKYRQLLDSHVLPRWGELRLTDIETEDIAMWVAKLINSEDGSGLGPSQARLAFRVLSMVLGWCVPRRLRSNPALGVKLPVLPDAEHIYLTYEQVEALAEASTRLRTKYNRPTSVSAVNRPLILLLAYTGLRWGEAAALRVRHIDLAKRRIRVAATLGEINGKHIEGLPKGGKRRTVPVPGSLVEELRPLVDSRPSDTRVFVTAKGNALRKNNWRTREFLPAVEASGVKVDGLTPHKLRHTAASLAIAAGADVKVVQQMLGHADAAMTLNIYGHLFPDRLDEVAESLDSRRRQVLERREPPAA